MRHGQRVRLKSGGAIMFVVTEADGYVVCAWFDAGGRHEGRYPPVVLEPVD